MESVFIAVEGWPFQATTKRPMLTVMSSMPTKMASGFSILARGSLPTILSKKHAVDPDIQQHKSGKQGNLPDCLRIFHLSVKVRHDSHKRDLRGLAFEYKALFDRWAIANGICMLAAL
jgi:hypothetical protein